MSVNSGSLDPAPAGASLSYGSVTFPDCCPDQAPRPAPAPAPTPAPPPPPPAPCQTGCQPADFASSVENGVTQATTEPFPSQENEEVTVLGERGIWTNRAEVAQWRGDLAITEYPINEDREPTIIRKKYPDCLNYDREIAIRYLRPPAPQPPGDIIIRHEPNRLPAPAPPLIIRQTQPRPCTPEPLVVRENPPTPPAPVGQKVITIAGRGLPPPPRKVIIERLPKIPPKPQAIINERWLPYEKVKRRVIYQPPQPDPVYCKVKNVIVEWDEPCVNVETKIKYLGVVNANPQEYISRYGETLKSVQQFPDILRNIKHEDGVILAADARVESTYELTGDVAALKLVDLQREGLSEYAGLASGSSASLGSAF